MSLSIAAPLARPAPARRYARPGTADDPIAPARGIVVGLGLGLSMWAALAWVVGRLLNAS